MSEELAPREIEARTPIRLGQLLQVAGVAQTGAHARELITEGLVSVDGQVELRRGANIHDGAHVDLATEPPERLVVREAGPLGDAGSA